MEEALIYVISCTFYFVLQPFDEGEFTVGLGAADLKVAGICRGGIVAYLTVPINDEKGNPVTKPNALCIYEEDDGLLWAHSGRDGRVVHARSQRLTITFLTTLSNYDYKFSWHFHQDATIEFNVELHGIIGSQLLAQNVTDAGGFGVPVFPQINGQFHQQFCYAPFGYGNRWKYQYCFDS